MRWSTWDAHGTVGVHGGTVLVSFMIRLVPSELERGQLVGQVVDIDSGVDAPIRNADELVEFCRLHRADPASPLDD